MGRGDKKSKKGKLRLGSYGNSRRKNTIKVRLRRRLSAKPATAAPAVQVVDVVEAKPKVKRTTKKKTETPE